VANAEELIDLCAPESDRKEQLLFAIRKFNAATGIMRQKSDFSDEQIQLFQANIDDFFQVWVRLYSYAGCTNYIHLLSSGHIAACLDGGTYTAVASRVGSTLTPFLKYSFFAEQHMVAMLAGVKPRKQQLLQRISFDL
jgi:hypothetical protein